MGKHQISGEEGGRPRLDVDSRGSKFSRMAHEIFISHAFKDKGIADAICGKLESANVRCWIAPRNIPPGKDWARAIREAINSSRVVVLVLSENANAATHIEREIANAFHTGRIIIPFRLGNAIPRRNLLYYLGNVRWLDSVDPPAEQDLEALTACIKGMPVGAAASGVDLSPQGGIKKTVNLSRNSLDCRVQTILKRVAIIASVFAAGLLLWLAREQNVTQEGTSLQSRHYGAKASRGLAKEDASGLTPRYTFTRLGLWEPVNPSPTPVPDVGPQETLSAMSRVSSVNATASPSSVDLNASAEGESGAAHGSAIAASTPNNPPRIANRRERHRGRLRPKSERSRFTSIGDWLSALWRKMREARN